MALNHSHFANFAQVEDWYSKTKPMAGVKNAGLDIRPLGDRARKYERIVKIDNDCYALSDGWHRGDAVFTHYTIRGNSAPMPTLADMERFAPIVWRRYGQGVETVTVRNGNGPYMHSTRYGFLARNMPRGLSFVQTQQGKQFVRMWGVDTQLFLAKGTYVTQFEYDDTSRPTTWATGTTDNTSLTFRLVGEGSWEFISNNGAAPPVPRIIVDKEAKAQYKGVIHAFCEWAMIMAPMIDIADWRVRQEYTSQFDDWLSANLPAARRRGWGSLSQRVKDAEVLRSIVANPDHPMRVNTLVCMVFEANMEGKSIQTKEDLSKARSAFNRWINKTLGFTKKG